jgi:hypothetical protein
VLKSMALKENSDRFNTWLVPPVQPHLTGRVQRLERQRCNSCTAFLVVVSGHKLEFFSDSSFCLVFYLDFSIIKMLFMNRLEFSCFADFCMDF